MKNFQRLIQFLALAFSLTINAAYGADFNYSYTFDNGTVASGSLTGTQIGSLVNNVTNVTLFFNGTPPPGSIFSSRYDSASPPFFYVSGPIVSFNALQNNFVFSNGNQAGGDFGDSFFSMINKTANPPFDSAVGISTPANVDPSSWIIAEDLPTVPARWSLTAVGAVPDEGTTFAMLGIGMAGLMWIRRKL